MRFALCQELFEGWEWERQCAFMQQCGYGGVEVAPFTLAPDIKDVSSVERQKLRDTASIHHLEIIGLHWLLAKTEGLHLTTSDATVRSKTTEYLKDLANTCADLGGKVMVFGSPDQRNLEDGMALEQAMENAAEVFRAAMPVLEERGVELCFEPLTPKETDFVNTCAEARQLIERVDSPNFVLHQDVKAMLGAETDSIEKVIADFADVTHHFHVNDINLLGPGMGETDFEPIFRALLESGYLGWVSVEVFNYSPGAETIARQSIDYMQEVLAEVSSN